MTDVSDPGFVMMAIHSRRWSHRYFSGVVQPSSPASFFSCSSRFFAVFVASILSVDPPSALKTIENTALPVT